MIMTHVAFPLGGLQYIRNMKAITFIYWQTIEALCFDRDQTDCNIMSIRQNVHSKGFKRHYGLCKTAQK